ncbi:MAG: phosphate ABC transporter substrate-binding protein PstS [Fibrobacterota bacterium]
MIKISSIYRLAPLFLFLTYSYVFSSATVLRGAGATFPYPLYKKWFLKYSENSDARIIYEPAGSGTGIKKLLSKSVDFGATDAFLSNSELSAAGSEIIHIPTCIGAVAIIYNLSEARNLCFSPETIAGIFSGTIKKWDHKEIRKENPNATLPSEQIKVIHRSEGSGTTFIFTDYLSKVSKNWKKSTGRGKRVRWQTGMGVEGNEGMAEFISRVSGSIGYAQHSFAANRGLPAAAIKNRSGKFITPNLKSLSLAADLAVPDDSRIMITDTPSENGYPISAFTYIIVQKKQDYAAGRKKQARSLFSFLDWCLTEGQKYTSGMGYAPLPSSVVIKAKKNLRNIIFDRRPLN